MASLVETVLASLLTELRYEAWQPALLNHNFFGSVFSQLSRVASCLCKEGFVEVIVSCDDGAIFCPGDIGNRMLFFLWG